MKDIEKIRLKNNHNTINILRLAFKFYPEDSRELLIKVNEGDAKISNLLNQLTLSTSQNYLSLLDKLEMLRRENNSPWMELYELARLGDEKEYNILKDKADNYCKSINKL
jgi:hypothetical protein